MSSNQNLSEMLAALAGAADSSPAAPGGTGSGGTSSPSTGSYVLIGDGGGRRGTGGGAGSLTADDGGVMESRLLPDGRRFGSVRVRIGGEAVGCCFTPIWVSAE